jgi:ubiquinol-cytochrome c reductase cytochrome b subunit
VAATVFYMIMLLEGANDLIADHLDIPLYTVTWIARFAVFIGPAVAYWLTKRICLGLQRKDRDLLHHGVETGIIRQLPSGEFIEVTRPVSDERRAVLLSKKEPVALPAAGVPDENGIPAPGASSLGGRVRLAANRVYSEGIPMTTNGHGNGHGGNGHGSNGHSGNGHGNGHVGGADHAAVGTTSSSPAIEDSGEPAAGDQGPVSGGDADS